MWKLVFIPPYRGGGGSAIYSCKIDVEEKRWDVMAARVSPHWKGHSTLGSGAHCVK